MASERRDADYSEKDIAMPEMTYCPDIKQSAPTNSAIHARLSHYGRHYFLQVAEGIEIDGKVGITYLGQEPDGRKRYQVTIRAYEKIKTQHDCTRAEFLD